MLAVVADALCISGAHLSTDAKYALSCIQDPLKLLQHSGLFPNLFCLMTKAAPWVLGTLNTPFSHVL